MTRLALPPEITGPIALSATIRAKQYASQRGWQTDSIFNPIAGIGYAGIKVAKPYLMYQERGTAPFLMTQLEGKTIPIRGKGGLHFVKVKDVGKPGMVTLPDGTQAFRDQKWLNPGIKPTYFMTNAIQYGIKDNKQLIQNYLRSLMGVNS